MITADELPLAARIGWDWANDHHDLALQSADSDSVEHLRIPHTPEAVRECTNELQRRFEGRPWASASRRGLGPSSMPSASTTSSGYSRSMD